MTNFKAVGIGFLVLVTVVGSAAQQRGAKHRISPKEAGKIALHKYKGKMQGSPHLENEDGKWQYEVLIRSGKLLKEVNVDATTGKIASVENTSVKEERREAAKDSKKAKAKKKEH